MKRNWDLIRLLMIDIEEHPHFHINSPYTPEIAGRVVASSPEEVAYHLRLLADAGLLLVPDPSLPHINGFGQWSPDVILGLSWAGHEFLDTVRSDTIWEKTKTQFIGKGAELSFELIKQTALLFVKQHLGLP
ncbi:hypothetical protein BGV52_15320 [Burkholderia ubonensis]|uniref:DUF2513 domain-containing protein n=1 Tax=Burkholderia ubonensis TaxID=101571 RepID=UPI0007527DC1|nr:DUF2513 domain-containing protein [Burkholderia ubonensis]KVU68955.1 hypothetical protein WK72_14625 [Burkholderia ubonensis]KVW40337.1 hypothetical protein WK94_23560 [Burkholderia ubonensis]KWH15644.1 hypothetical protein WL97_16530 [Burkholderia ubonensis]OJB09056.1 hypothetical protein BGV52_15320 [Burkholderia ubonensis]